MTTISQIHLQEFWLVGNISLSRLRNFGSEVDTPKVGVDSRFLTQFTLALSDMPQTLLAIMAMVLTSFFAFNQHRSILETRLSMIAQEVELRSTAVAVDLIEEIGSLAFDEATKDESINSIAELTLISNSEQNEFIESAQADDIDDFNGKVRTVTREIGDSQLSFTGRTAVTYVDSYGTYPSSTPTKYKQVTVVVKSLDFALADSVTITKVVSCGSRCNW